MKPLLRHLLAAALCLLPSTLSPLRAAPEPVDTPKVRLIFTDWEKFSDIVLEGSATKNGSDFLLNELQRHLLQLAKRRLEPGQTLVVTMQDIDLAGTVEPWRGPDFGRVRYMRDTHPPRLVFDYQVLDSAGTVVRQGSEKLINLAYRYQTATIGRDETAFFEKQLLSEWMNSTFSRPKKSKPKTD